MIYQNGRLARPLDAVLSAPSRLAVLRALFRARAPLSGRAVARLAGINHQGAAVALAGLAKLGLVERRPAGRSDQWRLDKRKWLMTELLLPLLEREAAHADAVANEIKKALRGRAEAVLIAAKEPLQLIVVEGRRSSEAVRGLKALLEERWALAVEVRSVSRAQGLRAVALENLWELLPVEGPPSYFAAGRTAQR